MIIGSRHIPNVDLAFMNDDHQEFINIFNGLYGLLDKGDTPESEIRFRLENLLEHCKEHFSREEWQMESKAFPAYVCHKSEHQRVLRQMEQEMARWQSDADFEQLREYLACLPEWMSDHVSTMDTVTASYIALRDEAR